ncbi:MAG TPA: hypothetical protein VMQ56_17135 [Terracidiphilus sp.]|nr:hypothetical protein [Terracidiphilus sp.]
MIPSMNTRHLCVAIFVVWGSLLGSNGGVIVQAQSEVAVPRVPFVGCKSDGQMGPLKAPKEDAKKLAVPAELINRLAYYRAEEGFGVLAPRGWHCFSTYGSNGGTLYVTPEPIDGAALLSSGWSGFAGQAIQVSVSVGDTSGRFEVARVIARVFPDLMGFVKDVIAEGIEPAASFPVGPYPTDKLTYRSKKVVEFETPPNSKGLGTDSRLRVNASPIRGVAILFGEEPSLVHASLRLPAGSENLIQTIIGQIEKEAVESDHQ